MRAGSLKRGAQMEFEPHSPPAEGLVPAFRKYLNARNRSTTCTRCAPKTAKLMVYSHGGCGGEGEGDDVPFISSSNAAIALYLIILSIL